MDKHTKIFIAGVTALSLAGAASLVAVKYHPTATDEKKYQVMKYSSLAIAAVGIALIIGSHIIKTK